jgi:serine/threonine protein kinase
MRPGDQVGPFVIDKPLGSGAMGTVLRGRHIETGQRVAIKVVAPAFVANEKSIERFKRESAILKQLKHPNIVRLIAVGKHHGTPFYAMEYVEGESLAEVLARRGRITWEELIPLGQQLCAALQHVHDRGIIHRDLKPSNVMVLPDGTVKLTDFGIAKDTDVTALTAANCTVGTASYMSPEQCKGVRDLTPRSDLYSLGVMFFELLTGKKPFQAESPMDMFMHHINDTPERPSRLVLEIPVWLDTLIVQLLEKAPEQRPHSAAAVGEALGRVQEKALALQSAGVDMVRGRAVDRRPGGPRLEEEDKDAARTLLGKKKKR